MKLEYNAPVVLTFALTCFAVMALSDLTGGRLTGTFFSAPTAFDSAATTLDYVRLLSHVLGHQDWPQLVGNVVVILLIGPVIEEKYGSIALLIMVVMTATITALINLTFFSSHLLGASSIAFMLILVTSITKLRHGRLPITVVLIVLLYMMPEVFAGVRPENLSQLAPLIGGVCGSLFGFLFSERRAPEPQATNAMVVAQR